VTIIWNTDELKRFKPTPSDEARWGLAVIEDSLWETIPKVYRRLNDIFVKNMGKGLPKNFNPIEFGSWMGGDRDGNPNVTAMVTKEVVLLSRWEAAKLYEKQLTKLIRSLSMSKCSNKILKKTAEKIQTQSIDDIKKWVSNEFKKHSFFELEYFVIADEETLENATILSPKKQYRAFIAVYANTIRLIDNISLSS
jgi:phosphoenolpyruvate carboxylase